MSNGQNLSEGVGSFKQHFDEVITKVDMVSVAEQDARQQFDLEYSLERATIFGTAVELREMGMMAGALLESAGVAFDFVLMGSQVDVKNVAKKRVIATHKHDEAISQSMLSSGWYVSSVERGTDNMPVLTNDGRVDIPVTQYDHYYVIGTRGVARTTERMARVDYTAEFFPYGMELHPEFEAHADPEHPRSISRIPAIQEDIVRLLQRHQIL